MNQIEFSNAVSDFILSQLEQFKMYVKTVREEQPAHDSFYREMMKKNHRAVKEAPGADIQGLKWPEEIYLTQGTTISKITFLAPVPAIEDYAIYITETDRPDRIYQKPDNGELHGYEFGQCFRDKLQAYEYLLKQAESKIEHIKLSFAAISFDPGEKVTYAPQRSPNSSSALNPWGRLRRVHGNAHAFVVFNCGGNWSKYTDYDAQRCRLIDLKKGWIGEGPYISPDDPWFEEKDVHKVSSVDQLLNLSKHYQKIVNTPIPSKKYIEEVKRKETD